MRINCGREPADIERAFERLTRYFQPSLTPQAIRSPRASESDRTAPTPLPASAPRRRLRGLAIPYLRLLARIFLRRKKPLVIAITGSRGKTVTKRLLAELLAMRYRVRTNPRSYNTEIGLPLAVLNVEIAPQSVWSVLSALGRASWSAPARRYAPPAANRAARYCNCEYPHAQLQHRCRTAQHLAGGNPDLVRHGRPTLPVYHRRRRSAAGGHGCGCPRCGGRVCRPAPGAAGPTRHYPVSRELIGESERSSVQAAVLLAERWTELSRADINGFLAAQGERAEPR